MIGGSSCSCQRENLISCVSSSDEDNCESVEIKRASSKRINHCASPLCLLLSERE